MGFEQAWLSYRLIGEDSEWRGIGRICANPENPIMRNAVGELQKAFREMTGIDPVLCSDSQGKDLEAGSIRLVKDEEQRAEGYHIYEKSGDVVIAASSDCGWLYGAFELIRQMQAENPLKGMNIEREPVMPMRMLNHWDNMDGSIERGYSGNSFFLKIMK